MGQIQWFERTQPGRVGNLIKMLKVQWQRTLTRNWEEIESGHWGAQANFSKIPKSKKEMYRE